MVIHYFLKYKNLKRKIVKTNCALGLNINLESIWEFHTKSTTKILDTTAIKKIKYIILFTKKKKKQVLFI